MSAPAGNECAQLDVGTTVQRPDILYSCLCGQLFNLRAASVRRARAVAEVNEQQINSIKPHLRRTTTRRESTRTRLITESAASRRPSRYQNMRVTPATVRA